jgi:hypothetical protein
MRMRALSHTTTFNSGRFCQHKFDVIRSATKSKTMALTTQQGGHYRGYKDDDLARELMKRFVQAVARAFYDDPKVTHTDLVLFLTPSLSRNIILQNILIELILYLKKGRSA